MEGIGIAAVVNHEPSKGGGGTTATTNEEEESQHDKRPLWVQDEENRHGEPMKNVRFLRERGYTSSDAQAICCSIKSRTIALRRLYLKKYYGSSTDDQSAAAAAAVGGDEVPEDWETRDEVPEEVAQARVEEKEVLVAMFGFEDDDDEAAAKFSNMDDENLLDVSLPIAYEPPERYGSPPALMLEVYVDNNMAPLYPNEPPVLAVVGGGLPEGLLRELTKRVREESQTRAIEEPGEPQIFNLIAFVAESAECIVQEETTKLEEEQKKIWDAKKAAAEKARKVEKDGDDANAKAATAFTSEAERRAYAKEVAASGAYVVGKLDDGKEKKKKAGEFNAKTGVSDRSLIDDLFS